MSAVRIWDRFKNLLDVNWGSIADGQLLKRSGTNIIGVTAGGGRSYNTIGNPNFEVDQRSVGASVPITSPSFVIDRWAAGLTGTMRYSVQQLPTDVVVPGTNFGITSKILRTTLTTAQGSLGASDWMANWQTIEGCSARELYGDVHSMSLLARSSVANLKFSMVLFDNTAAWSLNKLCTMGAANTWTLITLPNMPAWPGGATMPKAPGTAGYYLYIYLACGSSLVTTSPDVWLNTGKYGVSGMDNFASKSVGSTFDMAFVQHEPGPDCSTLMDCPWQQNYDDCLRYYCKSYPYGSAAGTIDFSGAIGNFIVGGAVFANGGLQWPKRMAKTPTFIGIYNPNSGALNAAWDGATGSSLSVGVAYYSETGLTQLSGSGMTVGHPLMFHYLTDTNW